MAESTGIEWADSTFNPWIGCTQVSPACDHCYAAVSTPARTQRIEWGAGKPRVRTSAANWAMPLRWERENAAFFAIHGRRRRVFCASLADVFDNEAPNEWRDELGDLIQSTPNLNWMLLTKRIGNAAQMLFDMFLDGAPENLHLGATICNQAEADRDIPKLIRAPVDTRFLSIEPMLGQIDLRLPTKKWGSSGDRCAHCCNGDRCDDSSHYDRNSCPHCRATGFVKLFDLVIAGGESGPHARPSHPDWLRSLRDQCEAASVPFMFKQWGEWCPRGPESMGYPSVEGVQRIRLTDRGENGGDLCARGDSHVWMNRAGKRLAGRLLDGLEHNGVIL